MKPVSLQVSTLSAIETLRLREGSTCVLGKLQHSFKLQTRIKTRDGASSSRFKIVIPLQEYDIDVSF